MTYHVARNNQPLGTFSKEDAAARYARGEILHTDLVWTEGMANWRPASQTLGAPAGLPVAAYGMAPRPAKPDNYLAWAIISALCCCMPLSIFSIVYAVQVDSKYLIGDYAGAEVSSKKARKFAIISAVAWFVVIFLYFVFAVGTAGAR